MHWFSNPYNAAALIVAAKKWLGTPFAPYQCAQGLGVDCVQLAGALMVAGGVLERQPHFGAYSLDLAAHTKREMITEWLVNSERFYLLDGVLGVGDVITFRIGKAVNHVGVMISDRDFIHSIQGARVSESTLDDVTWGSRVASYWRAF